MNWSKYAAKYGIRSAEAYRHLFENHSHPLAETGDERSYVLMDDAIKAVQIAERTKKVQRIRKEGIE